MARRARSKKLGNGAGAGSKSMKARGVSKTRIVKVATNVKPIEPKHVAKDPKWYRVWLGVKSCIQFFLSVYSLKFIYESNIMFPGYYDPYVWEKHVFHGFFIAQACFETVDFLSECTSYYLQRDLQGTLSLDSIVHHILTAAYYLQAVFFLEDPAHEYLGMVMAAICCQVIGPLYNTYRFGFRGKIVLVLMIVVQFVFRWPLGLMSIMRSFIHFGDTPVVHFFMSSLLSILDYRWSGWMIKRLLKVRESDRAKKVRANELQWLETLSYAETY